jgi:hypothetical protein
MKTLYYLDIDNTLIDREKYQTAIQSNLKNLLASFNPNHKNSKTPHFSISDYFKIYEENRLGNQVNLENVIQELHALSNIPQEELWSIYLDHDFSKFLLDGARDLVQEILSQENNQIIYWTDGNEKTQFQKINRSGLWQEGNPQNKIKVFNNQKKDNFDPELSQIEPESKIIVIDDNQEVLLKAIESANKYNLEITTIWISPNKDIEGRFSHNAENPAQTLEFLRTPPINPEGNLFPAENKH